MYFPGTLIRLRIGETLWSKDLDTHEKGDYGWDAEVPRGSIVLIVFNHPRYPLEHLVIAGGTSGWMALDSLQDVRSGRHDLVGET